MGGKQAPPAQPTRRPPGTKFVRLAEGRIALAPTGRCGRLLVLDDQASCCASEAAAGFRFEDAGAARRRLTGARRLSRRVGHGRPWVCVELVQRGRA